MGLSLVQTGQPLANAAPFPCSLHGKDWTLKTTFTRETNRALQADSARTPVNYSITEMLTHNELDEPVVQQLQDLDKAGEVQV